MIELTLPYPPTVNHYKRAGRVMQTKNGRVYQARINTEATKRFYFEVWLKVRGMDLSAYYEAPIALEIDVYPPDNRKRDIDNIIKPTLDALQKADVYEDDYQIGRLLVTRMSIIEQGQIIVRIMPL